MSDLMDAKHLAVLQAINDYFTETGVNTHLLEKSPEIPVDMLITLVNDDYRNRERAINYAFLPVGEDDLREISVLQFFSILPGIVYDNKDMGLKELIVAINMKTTLGGFTVTDTGEVALRYIHVMPKFGMTGKEAFLELSHVYKSILDRFGPKLEAYTSGEQSLDMVLLELV